MVHRSFAHHSGLRLRYYTNWLILQYISCAIKLIYSKTCSLNLDGGPSCYGRKTGIGQLESFLFFFFERLKLKICSPKSSSGFLVWVNITIETGSAFMHLTWCPTAKSHWYTLCCNTCTNVSTFQSAKRQRNLKNQQFHHRK